MKLKMINIKNGFATESEKLQTHETMIPMGRYATEQSVVADCDKLNYEAQEN